MPANLGAALPASVPACYRRLVFSEAAQEQHLRAIISGFAQLPPPPAGQPGVELVVANPWVNAMVQHVRDLGVGGKVTVKGKGT